VIRDRLLLALPLSVMGVSYSISAHAELFAGLHGYTSTEYIHCVTVAATTFMQPFANYD
jgi:hypothetical protein